MFVNFVRSQVGEKWVGGVGGKVWGKGVANPVEVIL